MTLWETHTAPGARLLKGRKGLVYWIWLAVHIYMLFSSLLKLTQDHQRSCMQHTSHMPQRKAAILYYGMYCLSPNLRAQLVACAKLFLAALTGARMRPKITEFYTHVLAVPVHMETVHGPAESTRGK